MVNAAGATVGEALAAAGIELNDADVVLPERDAPVTPGMHVHIQYARRLHVTLGSTETVVYSQAGTVEEALLAAGIDLQPQDGVTPARDAAVRDGMTVSLNQTRENVVASEEVLPFETVYEYDAEAPDGETVLLQAGYDGYVRREFRVRMVDGSEASRELLSEAVVQPTDEVISIGTYVAAEPTDYGPAPPAAPAVASVPGAGECARVVNVYATWYTAASAGGNTTATGTGVYKGIVAVDPAYIPLGTRMYIPGYGYGVAADTGGGVRGWFIDLGYGPNDAYDWHSRNLDICILP